jgi:uncharacterized membrane protein YfcA
MTTLPSVWVLIVAGFILALGALFQGTIGFGANIIAAPLLLLVDPAYVPVPIITVGIVSNLLLMHRTRATPVVADPVPAVWGLLPGTAAGVCVVALTHPGAGLSVLFAGFILVAVGLSMVGWRPRRTRWGLFLAGTLSGLMGTVSGIGGPPIALILQDEPGPGLRRILYRFFFVSGILALVATAVVSHLFLTGIWLGLLLTPGAVLGLYCSRWLVGRVDAGLVRVLLLLVSSLSALLVIVHVLV